MTTLSNWNDELNNAALYRVLSEVEKDPHIAEVYRRMGDMEAHHAEVLAERMRQSGQPMPVFKPTWRTRTLSALARRFGPGFVLPSVVTMEEMAGHGYSGKDGDATMAAQEQSHARLLRQITGTSADGMQGAALAQIEGRHKGTAGNALRAAVLGANDGLVSNLSLVMGVAGAAMAGSAILITGLAGLLAGAISMALGEWLSVQSSRELYKHQIGLEEQEIAIDPMEEIEELTLIYQARGLTEEQARQLATQIMSDPKNASDTLAREELGINPEELGGSAWEAAITSFVLFAIGAIIPVFAYFFLSGMTAVVVSVLMSTVGLFAIGAAITLFTGRTVLFSGTRQVLFGLAAAAVTYGVGRLIGVSLIG